MQRESGFYFVLQKGEWIVAEYNKARGCWWMCGSFYGFDDSNFSKIDETPLIHQL